MTVDLDDPMLTTAQVSLATNIPEATLRWWRHMGTGPKGFRLGARKVMYRRSDVLAWLDEQYGAEAARESSGSVIGSHDAA